MKLPFIRKKEVGNVHRHKKTVKPVRKPSRWAQPLLRGMVILLVVVMGGFGIWKLNTQCHLAYWDIEAAPHIKTQIQAYLEQQKNLDYWHTRAAVLQAGLIAHIPDIQRVQVSRILPDGLWVRAIARRPMALWKDTQARQVKLVDEKGVAYRPLGRGEMVDLPVLRVSRNELGQAIHLLLALHTYAEYKLPHLSEVMTTDKGWRLNFSQGEQWHIASTDVEKQIAQVINILASPRWAKGRWRIDARIPERWFIRPARQEVI